MGIESSPAFVRQPEGNGVAERFIRTLKEQLLWVRRFATVEELRLALLSSRTSTTASGCSRSTTTARRLRSAPTSRLRRLHEAASARSCDTHRPRTGRPGGSQRVDFLRRLRKSASTRIQLADRFTVSAVSKEPEPEERLLGFSWTPPVTGAYSSPKQVSIETGGRRRFPVPRTPTLTRTCGKRCLGPLVFHECLRKLAAVYLSFGNCEIGSR